MLGDSLALSPTPDQSFPVQLQARFDATGLPVRVVNASVWGDTTGDALRRLNSVLVDAPRVLVAAVGANDGLQGAPIETVERNLAGIISTARQRNLRILLCGMEAPPVRGWQYTLEFHQVFPRLAARHNVPLVRFLLAGVLFNPEMNGADGVHPNAAGARRIADTVWPYLEPLVRQDLSTNPVTITRYPRRTDGPKALQAGKATAFALLRRASPLT